MDNAKTPKRKEEPYASGEAQALRYASGEAQALSDVRWVAGSPVELLEGGLDVAIPAGTQHLRNTMSQLTARTGREVALLRMEDGTRILRMGDEFSVSLHGGVRRIIGHTHPSGRLQFSDFDIRALMRRGQHSSVIIDPRADMGARLPVP